MILGVGTDIVSIPRIERLLRKHPHFPERLFHPNEYMVYETISCKQKAAYVAKRFAAKEACAKALGTGFQNGLTFKDMLVLKNDLGAPFMSLVGTAHHLATQKVGQPSLVEPSYTIDVSLSDEAPFALAFVILSTAK